TCRPATRQRFDSSAGDETHHKSGTTIPATSSLVAHASPNSAPPAIRQPGRAARFGSLTAASDATAKPMAGASAWTVRATVKKSNAVPQSATAAGAATGPTASHAILANARHVSSPNATDTALPTRSVSPKTAKAADSRSRNSAGWEENTSLNGE